MANGVGDDAGSVGGHPVVDPREPIVWKVKEQRLGAVDAILLGDTPDDTYRLSITVGYPEAPYAQIVYPCARCGWAFACGSSGEDCHP